MADRGGPLIIIGGHEDKTGDKLILPAFGALTGGLDAHHPEIIRAVGPRAEALVPLNDRLLRFPLIAA